MYNSTKDIKKWEEFFEKIRKLYESIPNTKGCLDWISKSEGGCGAWCCSQQHPHLLYSEFKYLWENAVKKINKDQFIDLIRKSLYAYLFEEHRKSCVILNTQNNKCSFHENRPYNCRVYGIIPEEEFKPRYEKLKVLYPDTRQQCNLISTIDGKNITKEQTNFWWSEILKIEEASGINKKIINDEFGGSYRTHYEHILLEIVGEEGMYSLSKVRELSSKEEKEETISMCIESLSSMIK